MKVYNLDGKIVKEIELPEQFKEPYHPNLIKRAVLTIQSNKRHSYGAKKEAGKRASAKLSKRRRNYRGSYGHGISRVPRKILWRRGMQFGWTGAFAPGTVGGRKAHPPKAEKRFNKKINEKEKRKAIRSALSATLDRELVASKHIIPKLFPLLVDSKLEDLDKIKEVKATLNNLGLKEELKRIEERKIRSGKGKLKGRKYKAKVGPLIVVSKKCKLERSCRNLLGIDVIKINHLNAELLAPGAVAGRLTIYTEKVIEKLEKEKLFTSSYIKINKEEK